MFNNNLDESLRVNKSLLGINKRQIKKRLLHNKPNESLKESESLLRRNKRQNRKRMLNNTLNESLRVDKSSSGINGQIIKQCTGRESNPGLPRGRREFYH